MDHNKLWKMERNFWLDGPEFFEKSMASEARMVFPAPVGILAGAEIVEGLRQGPRWKSVDFDDRTASQLGDTFILAYRATGKRDGEESYMALCGSTYVRQANEWLLLSHQQTPIM
jgi:hypothetical protein